MYVYIDHSPKVLRGKFQKRTIPKLRIARCCAWRADVGCGSSLRQVCLCTCAVTTVSHAGALEPIRLTVTVPQCLSAGHPYCTKSRSQSMEAVTLAAQLCHREATESIL